MSSLKLNKNLENKSREDLVKDLNKEYKQKNVFRLLTLITGVFFLGAVVTLLVSSVSPLLIIITFALFIVSFMLNAYSKQNIQELEGLIEAAGNPEVKPTEDAPADEASAVSTPSEEEPTTKEE